MAAGVACRLLPYFRKYRSVRGGYIRRLHEEHFLDERRRLQTRPVTHRNLYEPTSYSGRVESKANRRAFA